MNTKDYIQLRKTFENDIFSFLLNYVKFYISSIQIEYFHIAMMLFSRGYSIDNLIKHLDIKHNTTVILFNNSIINIYQTNEEIKIKSK
jgi:hypothetical protein